MIIRTAANEQEIEQSLETYWANDPPPDDPYKASVLRHWLNLFKTCPEGFWIAQNKATQQIVGVATAVLRPPQWVLANFFVLPAYHGQGIGKALLSQAFATCKGCERFAVHASQHPSAQSLYMQFGMYPLPYSIQFRGNPQNEILARSTLVMEAYPVTEILSLLNDFDQRALGFTRAVDHQWWAIGGSYFLVKSEGQPIAYFRVSPEQIIGPLVVSDGRWMTSVLDLAINKQREISSNDHEIFVPGTNRIALADLVGRGYRIVEINMLLSSHPMPGLAQVVFHDTDLL